MNEQQACIVTNDNGIADQIESAMQVERGSEVTCSQAIPEADPVHQVGNAGWVFVDLRNQENWSSFDQWAEYRQRSSSRMIAVVEQGLPVEHCLASRSTFDATLSSPVFDEQLHGLLNEKFTPSKRRGCPADPRVLSAGRVSLVTQTPALYSLFDTIRLVAEREFNVLLVGETGTGKTTLARIMHHLSARGDKPFVNVPCGALPSELMDSEMFGHVKGAFTSAEAARAGKFFAAKDGTILLDEIDVLGLPQQAKLLRVLETGEFECIGSNETLKSQVRVVAATNVDLEDLIVQKAFRPDLYFRLNQVKIEIPPLRERPLDIAPLIVQFLKECCAEQRLNVSYILPAVFDVLEAYDWPGNIRELRNEISRAALFTPNGVLGVEHLSINIKNRVQSSPAKRGEESVLTDEIAVTERTAIERMLKSHDFNRTATARALGISRVTLYNKIRKYRIRVEPPHRKSEGA